MKVKLIVLALLISTLVLMLFSFRWHVQRAQDLNVKSVVLPPNDNEKIIIDPSSHQITVINANGMRKEFLPGMRPSEIELRKNGDVVVTARQMGVERGLFIGGGFSNDGLRFGGGVDLFYYKKLDLGLFVSDSYKDLAKPRIVFLYSYTFWHDTRIGLGIDHTGSPNILLTERF